MLARFRRSASTPVNARQTAVSDLHGGGQGFDSAAVHQLVYACLQVFRDSRASRITRETASRQTFCKRTGWQKAALGGPGMAPSGKCGRC